MNILVLKAQWVFFGLGAPAFSWIVSAGLIAYCAWVYLRQLGESKIRQRLLSKADKQLRSIRAGFAAKEGSGGGIPRKVYNAIDKVFAGLPLLAQPWQAVRSSIVNRADADGEEKYWVSDDIGAVMKSDAITQPGPGFRNAPSIMTGIGLLATFLAILTALLDVRLADNKIHGLDLLISGLSGKFLSSVVAVACATLLLFAEKNLFNPVKVRMTSLGLTLAGLVPRLTPAQILLDSHQEMIRELRSLRERDTHISHAFNQGLKETMEPAMEKMAKRFSASLKGATEGHMGQVSGSLESTSTLLNQMNSQLALTGNVLRELTEMAKETAARESVQGRARLDEMTGAVDNLMERLEGHAGTSVGAMEKAMAAITCDMSRKITDLSEQMAAVIAKASETSTGTVREVLDHAGSLSSQSAGQLALLLKKHGEEMAKVDDLRGALEGTLKQFTASMANHAEMTNGLQRLTVEVNKNVSSLAQITKSVAESQGLAVKLLASTSEQIASLQGFSKEQQEAWERIEGSMTRYGTVFQHVETHAKELLGQIAGHLGGYSNVTEKHFNLLATTADNFISQATGRLSGSIDELGEQLDELHSAVSKMACASQQMR